MSRYYLGEGDWKEGDTIYFEMPSFCSGEYSAKVYGDGIGLYIKKEDNFFEGCRDYRLNRPYWKSIDISTPDAKLGDFQPDQKLDVGYYTPDISDLFVGYECEVWETHAYTPENWRPITI